MDRHRVVYLLYYNLFSVVPMVFLLCCEVKYWTGFDAIG